MKRRIVLITLISVSLLCSCSPADNGDQATVITPSETAIETTEASAETEASENTASETETSAETEAETSAETSAETEENTVSADTLSGLMDGNLYCMRYVFSLGSLPYSGDPVEGEYIYKVDDEKFKTFDDLKNYLLTVYSADYTDQLLYNTPYENDPLYLDINGELCINTANAGAKGYYVNWDNAVIDIKSSDSTSCKFTITGQLEEPAEEVIPEPYSVDAEAVYENGRWVLTKMIY